MLNNFWVGRLGQHISWLQIIVRALVAVLIGTIVGSERERKRRPAGLRTHILVSLAASVVAILENEMIYQVTQLSNSAIGVSVGRLTVGVLTGVGFLGAGTIMMNDSKITGLTTAASLWCTAALGLAAGTGCIGLALLGVAIAIATLEGMQRLEKKIKTYTIEIQYKDDDEVKQRIDECFKTFNAKIMHSELCCFKEGNEVNTNGTYYVKMPEEADCNDLIKALLAIPQITMAKN